MGAHFGRNGQCFGNLRADESSFQSGEEEESDASLSFRAHSFRESDWCSARPCCQMEGFEYHDCDDPYDYTRQPDPSVLNVGVPAVPPQPTTMAAVNVGVSEWSQPVKPPTVDREMPSVGTGSTIDTESGIFDPAFLDVGTPVPASRYEAVLGDPLDGALAQACKRLDSARASGLVILRNGPSNYDIGGRRVLLSKEGLNVVAKELNNNEKHDLDWYLSSAAEVEHHMGAGGPAITQVPKHLRLTFPQDPPADPTGKKKRKEAMRLAKQQAELREQNAQLHIKN